MIKLIFSTLLIATVTSGAYAQAVDSSQSKNARLMDPVVVTGQFQPESMRRSVYKVRTLDQALIQGRAATDLGSLLNTELGFRFTNDFTLGESDVSIMGMNGNNVKILLDGVPLVDRGSTKQSLSQIDINTIERVEIVEGPLSVVYGTDALAGVINIITKKAKQSGGLTLTARIQEESVGKTYSFMDGDGLHQESLSADWSKSAWKAGLQFSRNDFGGWKGNAELRMKEMKPKEQLFGGAYVGFSKKGVNALYRLDYLDEDIYVPGRYNQNNTALDADYLTKRLTHQLQVDWQASNNFQLMNSFSYQDYQRQTETYLLHFPGGEKMPSNAPGEWDLSTFKTFFGRSIGNWKISEQWSWQPGIEFRRDQASGDRIEGRPVITDMAFFNSLEYRPIAALAIRPGLRISHNSTYEAPPLIPSLNVKYALNGQTTLRASYARGFRAPTLRELYFLFKDANHDIVGNPNLKAEYSNSFNASAQWIDKKQVFSSTLSAFYNVFKNRIDLALGEDNVNTYFNIDEYRTIGFSSENSYRLNRFSTTLGLLYIARYNQYQDDPNYKESTGKKYAWSPEVNANISYRIPVIETELGLYYKFNGKLPAFLRGLDANNQQVVYLGEIDAYNWADITLSKTFFKSLTLQAGVKNLFNVSRLQSTATSSGSAHSDAGPRLMAYGRSGFVGLRYQLHVNNKNK